MESQSGKQYLGIERPFLSCNHIGYKCIFRKKIKVDGTIEEFKARLVAQGFAQRPDIDGFGTYAPTARTTTIRLLIALVAI